MSPGELHRVYKISCASCDRIDTVDRDSLRSATAQARSCGWSLTKCCGWMCKSCFETYKEKQVVTKVLFRWWEGVVIALFPEEPGDSNWHTCSSYMHVGQHGSADPQGIVVTSRPATIAEYKALRAELESIGYKLDVRQRLTPAMTKARRKALEASRA